MTIYAVTKGTYSDYHICALTLNKQKAERLAKLYSGEWDTCDIEEYEDGEGEELRVLWCCNRYGSNAKPCDFSCAEGVKTNVIEEISEVYVYAKDAKHAEKKAQDMIAEYKAKIANI